jgi:hypothetical protein
MIPHHLSDTAKHWVDGLAFLFAGVTVASFLTQLAVVVTILAGLASLSLAALRWHDRIKYGPGK